MATLALQPTAAATLPAAQEEPRASETTGFDGSAADPSDIDSGWVFLGESDVVPPELAAAAAAGRRRLGFSPLPMIPIWVQMVLGGVVYTAVPFYKRARQIEDKAIENVETALDVLEHAAEVTEKLAANVASSLPEDGSLQRVAEEIEYIAEVVDKDAQKVEVIIKKIEMIGDQIDAGVESVIQQLEKEFKPTPSPDAGSDAQK